MKMLRKDRQVCFRTLDGHEFHTSVPRETRVGKLEEIAEELCYGTRKNLDDHTPGTYRIAETVTLGTHATPDFPGRDLDDLYAGTLVEIVEVEVVTPPTSCEYPLGRQAESYWLKHATVPYQDDEDENDEDQDDEDGRESIATNLSRCGGLGAPLDTFDGPLARRQLSLRKDLRLWRGRVENPPGWISLAIESSTLSAASFRWARRTPFQICLTMNDTVLSSPHAQPLRAISHDVVLNVVKKIVASDKREFSAQFRPCRHCQGTGRRGLLGPAGMGLASRHCTHCR